MKLMEREGIFSKGKEYGSPQMNIEKVRLINRTHENRERGLNRLKWAISFY